MAFSNISRFPAATSNPGAVEDACRAISTIQSSAVMTIPVWDTLPADGIPGQILMVSGLAYVWDGSAWKQLAYV